MKKLYLFLLLASAAINAQTFEWLQTPPITFSMNPNMLSYATACDPAGNVYLSGFKDGAFPYTEILGNLYFNKYSSNGSEVFSKTITGKAFIYNMVSDHDGNIIMALGSYGAVTVDGTILTDSDTEMHFVLVKLDNEGSLLWYDELMINNNGFLYVSDFKGLAVDAQNNIYAGYDSYSICRITKYSPQGTALMTINQTNVSRITSIGVDDAGNIFAAGSCASGQLAIFNGVIAPSQLQYNTYIVKYSQFGAYQWVKFVDDVTCSEPRVAVSSENAIYFSSYLYGDFMFGDIQADGPGGVGSDFFLAKLDGGGNYQWVREVPGAGIADLGRSNYLNVDTMGNVYISGSTDGTVNWGNGQETGPGPRRSLLLKYNPEGIVLSATTAATGYGRADGVALNSNGDAFIGGMGFNAGTFGTINFQGPVNKYYAYLTKIASAPLSNSEINTTSISLYPNPASDFIYLQGTDAAKGSILNMLGQKVSDFNTQSSSPINVSGLPQGTYFVKIEGLSAKKFIKQ